METRTTQIKKIYRKPVGNGKYTQTKLLGTDGSYYTTIETSSVIKELKEGIEVKMECELTDFKNTYNIKRIIETDDTSPKAPTQGQGPAKPEATKPTDDGLATKEALEKYSKLAKQKYPEVSDEALCNITAALLNYERARHWFNSELVR